jgi:uracil-DNA glycosylase family 4
LSGPRIRYRSLDETQAAMQACRLCAEAGYEIYPRAIFSGNQNAEIMIIGQAPGITEKEAGRPFNAGSGTRLFQWLAEAGIREEWFRSTQYMTSVTKCYPGRASGGSGDRVPTRAEQALCRPFLQAEIAFVNPRLLIPIGRLAIEMFFHKSMPLTKIIGTEKMLDGRWIIPLPHPSGASRWHQVDENKAVINQAIERIRERSMQILSEPNDRRAEGRSLS